MTLLIPKPTGQKLIFNNGRSPAGIAGVAPTLDYRFARDRSTIEAVSLTNKLTFTGGNQGTFVNLGGNIEQAVTNTPRFDHNPSTNASLGLLMEESKQNLALNSEDASVALTITAVSISSNVAASPRGDITADLLTETTATSVHSISTNHVFVSNSNYALSAFVKQGPGSRYTHINAAGGAPGATFNLSNQTFTTIAGGQSNVSASIVPYFNGWYRCSLSWLHTAAFTSSSYRFGINNTTNPSPLTYTGDGISGIYVWGAQLETNSTASSYIPTTSAAVTRSADSATISGTGVITGTYTMVEKPAGCAVVSGGNIALQTGYTAERVMVFPTTLSAQQIADIRSVM